MRLETIKNRFPLALGPHFEALGAFKELSVEGSVVPQPEYLVIPGDRVHMTVAHRFPAMPYLDIEADQWPPFVLEVEFHSYSLPVGA